MGYTDPQRSVAYAPEKLLLGVIPSNVTISAEIKLAGVTIADSIKFTQSVPVVAAANVTPADIAAAAGPNAGLCKSLTDIALTLPKETGDEFDLVTSLGATPPKGAFIPGSGYGDVTKQNNLPLRGLPEVQREKIKLEFAARDATNAPAVVYGDGSDWDAIKMAPQSTTFVAPATDLSALTNTKLRMNFRENGSIPKLAGHGPQTSVETQDKPT